MKKSIIFSFLATCFFLQEGEAKVNACSKMNPKICETQKGVLDYLRNKCKHTHDCMVNYNESIEWIDGKQHNHNDWNALVAEVKAETDRSFRAR